MKVSLKMIFLAGLLVSTAGIAVEITSKQECEAAGGKWGQFGLFPKEQCNKPTTDSGKECTDSKQCQVACVTQVAADKFKQSGACAGPVYEGNDCKSKADCGGVEECITEVNKIPGKGACYGWTIMAGTCLSPVKGGMIGRPLCVD